MCHALMPILKERLRAKLEQADVEAYMIISFMILVKCKWCSMQVPALRKHLAATLKSEEEYLAGADAQEHHPAREAAQPIMPPSQEQQLHQAHVSSHPVETVRNQLLLNNLLWRRRLSRVTLREGPC